MNPAIEKFCEESAYHKDNGNQWTGIVAGYYITFYSVRDRKNVRPEYAITYVQPADALESAKERRMFCRKISEANADLKTEVALGNNSVRVTIRESMTEGKLGALKKALAAVTALLLRSEFLPSTEYCLFCRQKIDSQPAEGTYDDRTLLTDKPVQISRSDTFFYNTHHACQQTHERNREQLIIELNARQKRSTWKGVVGALLGALIGSALYVLNNWLLAILTPFIAGGLAGFLYCVRGEYGENARKGLYSGTVIGAVLGFWGYSYWLAVHTPGNHLLSFPQRILYSLTQWAPYLRLSNVFDIILTILLVVLILGLYALGAKFGFTARYNRAGISSSYEITGHARYK